MQIEVGSGASSGGNGGDGNSGGKSLPEVKIPAHKQEKIPTGKVDQVTWYAFRGKTRKELERPPYNFRPGTIRVGFDKLADLESEWVETPEKSEVVKEPSEKLPAVQEKGIQVFAKGSPPEAIIASIKLPLVDGQAEGFEKGMKFGMSVLTMAVRIMQELSAVSIQQVQPLIALTRSVREGEQAAFKGGADEGALKAARAMGETVLPALSEMQANIAAAVRGSEPDPFKGMMARTMEPLLKNMVAKMFPGMQGQGGPPAGFIEETR